MNVCVKIISMFFVFSACSAMQDTAIEIGNFKAKLRADCPIKLSEDDKKNIKENLEKFLDVLSKQDTFSGSDFGSKNNLFDLRCADLSNINMLSRQLSFLDLSGSNWNGAIMQNAYIFETNFSKASMQNMRAQNIRFEDCTFDNTDFGSSNLNNTQFLVKNKTQISAQGAKFIKTNFSNGAALRNMNLSKAVFDGADLSLAEIDNVIFDNNVSFKGAQFKSTRFTDTVKFGSSNNWVGFLVKQGAQEKDLVDTSFGPITTNFAASL